MVETRPTKFDAETGRDWTSYPVEIGQQVLSNLHGEIGGKLVASWMLPGAQYFGVGCPANGFRLRPLESRQIPKVTKLSLGNYPGN